MKIIEKAAEAFAYVNHWRTQGLTVGLVPTMGALHFGHVQLVRRSIEDCDITVVSIFVNPTQFGPNEDYSRYPRTLDEDFRLLQDAGVDLVFVPSNDELYPSGFSCTVNPPIAAQPLEGTFRPGHFQGVATVCLKLFHILPASVAYFGKKDFQQLTVISRMVDDLNVPIRIQGCETIRESDGLAMSSRNRYLSSEQRVRALSLSKALKQLQEQVDKGERDIAALEGSMCSTLVNGGVDKIDYARIVDCNTLEDLSLLDRTAVALIAVHVGTTRLIDNVELQPAND